MYIYYKSRVGSLSLDTALSWIFHRGSLWIIIILIWYQCWPSSLRYSNPRVGGGRLRKRGRERDLFDCVGETIPEHSQWLSGIVSPWCRIEFLIFIHRIFPKFKHTDLEHRPDARIWKKDRECFPPALWYENVYDEFYEKQNSRISLLNICVRVYLMCSLILSTQAWKCVLKRDKMKKACIQHWDRANLTWDLAQI